MDSTWDAVVVGAGAAGLLAAARLAERGRRTLLLEKNRKPGVKILMSGGTRCNITHHVAAHQIAAAFGPQGRFLGAALAALPPDRLVDLIESEGVPTKVEPSGKIFPVSDRAVDVLGALLDRLKRSGCQLCVGEPLEDVQRAAEGFRLATPLRYIDCRCLIVTTGGQSYPRCGTTGDGYRWAKRLGHRIVPPRPALVPLTTSATWVGRLQGITVAEAVVYAHVLPPTAKNVAAEPQPEQASIGQTLDDRGRTGLNPVLRSDEGGGTGYNRVLREEGKQVTKRQTLGQRRGSVLFTHFGLSGPAVLDLSSSVTRYLARREAGRRQQRAGSGEQGAGSRRREARTESHVGARVEVQIDLVPDYAHHQLNDQLIGATAKHGRRHAATHLHSWLPERLAEAVCQRAQVAPERPLGELTRHERHALIECLKALSIPIAGSMGFAKAEVTAGGIDLGEVDPRTMQSRLVPGLYLAGEVLDLDGPIGGYNFQAAFSTGWLAGERAS